MEIKSLSQSIFFICYEYIYNNSYINLDDGNHIKIIWSCSSNAVKTHNVLYILLKKLTTGRPVSKTLIEYSNSLEKNEEEEKKPINIELTDQNEILIMMKMLLNLNDQV